MIEAKSFTAEMADIRRRDTAGLATYFRNQERMYADRLRTVKYQCDYDDWTRKRKHYAKLAAKLEAAL